MLTNKKTRIIIGNVEKRTNVREVKIMTFLFTIQTILEVLAVGFVIWGIFNEDKLVSFEENIKCYFQRKNFKVVNNKNRYHKHCA